MEKLIKLFSILFFGRGRIRGQQIQQNKDYYVLQGDTAFMATYTIRNTSENSLFLWFDLDKKQTTQKDYFYTIKGDYSLLSILNDENFVNKQFDVINSSFIKQIKQKEKFVVSVLYKKKKDWMNHPFDDKIVLINEKDLSPAVKDALSRNGEYFYNAEFISIAFDSLLHVSKLRKNKKSKFLAQI